MSTQSPNLFATLKFSSYPTQWQEYLTVGRRTHIGQPGIINGRVGTCVIADVLVPARQVLDKHISYLRCIYVYLRRPAWQL